MLQRDLIVELGLRKGSLGGSREILLLDLSRLLNLSRGRASAVLVDGLLSLGSVLLSKSLDCLRRVGSLLASKIPDLTRLLGGKRPALLKLGVDDLLVLKVDERAEVGDDGSNESKAPHGNKLDKEVGDQGGEERSNSDVDVLGEDDALRLDDEEVDKLLDIVQETLQGRLGNSEVLARPELGCNTLSKSSLSSDLCRSSTAKHDPSRLEDVADDVEVTSGEDEDDSGGKEIPVARGFFQLRRR